ncbi:transcriptional regulator, LacI family [Abditibacterium utsteinense]|uniref:Transcriptional regulator, LacI family n=1 Tax=Abditibacterium utsteinense TaxID=1960156 RepID=A0A2S8SP72_9BACT|nr:LacI family DNA-binding transcriptional regulator [Abditibacterium utsteinense]PQV62579.1 transcriptional regulator, LacI family [Abditibacterium utsteinense]
MIQTALTVTENTKRQKPATLEDVAKLAGVHARTVADALKGTGRVAPATRERVLRIAGELNYVPNAAARALVTGRTGKVAVLSGPLNEPFYANIVHLLETHLTASGYEMMLLHTRREVKDLVQATQMSLVDGVIVISINRLAEEFFRLSGNSVQPCVFIDTSNPDFVDHITLDLRPAVEEALRLMLAAKRQRIAYVVNNRDDVAYREVRMGTYLQIMEEAGRAPEIVDVNTSLISEERIETVKTYIEAKGCPDALLCQNDETAIYTYRAIVGLGLRIPEDVMLVGCDGLPYMEFFDPPLSTIALPTEEICATAARFLQRRMDDPKIPIQQATVQGQLMIRKSLLAAS